MADAVSDLMNYLNTGTVFGVPVMFVILLAVTIIVIIYLAATRKPKLKEFKPLDLKKETRRRYNEQFKFFGQAAGMNIYEPNTKKPFGFVLGYMKAVWMDKEKRYEPIHVNYTKEQFSMKLMSAAQEVYHVPYDQLNDVQKKNIHELAKEELRDDTIQTLKPEEKIVRGRREIIEDIPVPAYLMKITKPNLLYKIIAQFTNIVTNWYVFEDKQIEFKDKDVFLTANFPREVFNSIFVFSKAGKNIVEDIAFGIEREEVLSATANQIPRTLHFDTEYAKAVGIRREESRLESDKWKHQKEAGE